MFEEENGFAEELKKRADSAKQLKERLIERLDSDYFTQEEKARFIDTARREGIIEFDSGYGAFESLGKGLKKGALSLASGVTNTTEKLFGIGGDASRSFKRDYEREARVSTKDKAFDSVAGFMDSLGEGTVSTLPTMAATIGLTATGVGAPAVFLGGALAYSGQVYGDKVDEYKEELAGKGYSDAEIMGLAGLSTLVESGIEQIAGVVPMAGKATRMAMGGMTASAGVKKGFSQTFKKLTEQGLSARNAKILLAREMAVKKYGAANVARALGAVAVGMGKGGAEEFSEEALQRFSSDTIKYLAANKLDAKILNEMFANAWEEGIEAIPAGMVLGGGMRGASHAIMNSRTRKANEKQAQQTKQVTEPFKDKDGNIIGEITDIGYVETPYTIDEDGKKNTNPIIDDYDASPTERSAYNNRVRRHFEESEVSDEEKARFVNAFNSGTQEENRIGSANDVTFIQPKSKSAKAFDKIAKTLGFEPVYYMPKTGNADTNNAFVDNKTGKLYLNASIAANSPMVGLGHEFGHWLRKNDTELWSKFNTVLNAEMGESQKAEATKWTKSAYKNESEDFVNEEINSQAWGDLFGDNDFLGKVLTRITAETNTPTMGKKFINMLNRMISAIKNTVGGDALGKKYISQLEKVKNTAIDVLVEYKKNMDSGKYKRDTASYKQVNNGEVNENTGGNVQESGEASGRKEVSKGKQHAVSTPQGGMKVNVHYEVVDDSEVVTSNDERFTGDQNRDLDTPSSRDKIADIATHLDPDRLQESATSDAGAMIILDNGSVQVGNHRMLGIRSASPALRTKYENAVRAYAKANGIEIKEGVQHPVLVRKINDTLTKQQLKDFADYSNTSNARELSTAEQATQDASSLKKNEKLIALFNPSESGEIVTKENDEFLKAFIRETGATGLINKDGSYNKEKLNNRVRNALLGYVFGGKGEHNQHLDKFIERAGEEGVKRQVQGLTKALPKLISLAKRKGMYNFMPDLRTALETWSDYLGSDSMTLDAYLGTSDMFEGNNDKKLSQQSESFLRVIDNARSAKQVFDYFDRVAELSDKQDTNPDDDIFGDSKPLNKGEVAKQVMDESETKRSLSPKQTETLRSVPNQKDGTRKHIDLDSDVRYSISNIYTGSAADYDKPSLHYVGTGEGQQAFGYGLYGTDNIKIAKQYAQDDVERKMGSPQPYIVVNGNSIFIEDIDKISDRRLGGAYRKLFQTKGDKKLALQYIDDAIDFEKRYGKSGGFSFIGNENSGDFSFEEVKDVLKNLDYEYVPSNHINNRHVYNQTIFPGKEENLLSWNEPIEQDVLDTLRSKASEDSVLTEELQDAVFETLSNISYHTDAEVFGGDLYKTLVKEFKPFVENAPKEVSAFLRRSGIDGIKYPAASMGRGYGENGWNYVVFSDEDIRVDEHIRYSLGNKARANYSEILKKKRPDMSQEQVDTFLEFLNTIDNKKTEKATFAWFAKGAIILPEDMPKVEQALNVAERAKVDPLQYNSPMELINTHADIEIKEKRINPDTVPTLRNKKVLPEGITVYEVDNSEESRQNMRKIINTHFGKDRSPWCLLHGDENGNLTEHGTDYWYNVYTKYPKRVAFHNGRLLAFFASDDTAKWWDRNDNDFPGIPVERLLPDNSGRRGTYVFDEESGTFSDKCFNIVKGDKGNGTYEEWYDKDKIKRRENYKDGELDGVREFFTDTGLLFLREHNKNGKYNGTREVYDVDKGKEVLTLLETYKDDELHGLSERFYLDGRIKSRSNFKYGKADGLLERFNEDGTVLARENYKNGNRHGLSERFNENGQIVSRENWKDGKADGMHEEWDSAGNLMSRTNYKQGHLDGLAEYFKYGKRTDNINYKMGKRNGYLELFYDNGQIHARTEYAMDKINGLHEVWDENGKQISKELYDNDELVKSLPIDDTADADVRHSRNMRNEQALEDVNRKFNEDVEKQVNGTLHEHHIFDLGKPLSVLLENCGLPNVNITMKSSLLHRKSSSLKHKFDINSIKDLPKYLNDPIAVFKYKDSMDNVIVELEHNGKNFLVGIHFDKNSARVSDIRGLFPKETSAWLNWIVDGKAIYLNKEKIEQRLSGSKGTNLLKVPQDMLDSVNNVLRNFKNATINSEKDATFFEKSAENDENVKQSLTRRHYVQKNPIEEQGKVQDYVQTMNETYESKRKTWKELNENIQDYASQFGGVEELVDKYLNDDLQDLSLTEKNALGNALLNSEWFKKEYADNENSPIVHSVIETYEKYGTDLGRALQSRQGKFLGIDKATGNPIFGDGKKSTLGDAIMEYWYNSILSGVGTQVRNISGNTFNLVWGMTAKRGTEAFVNLLAGRKHGATMGEFKEVWQHFDMKNAFKRAVEVFKTEKRSYGIGKFVENNRGQAIKGNIGKYIRLPGRFLAAADEFAKALVVPMEAAAYANREGIKKGLKGVERSNYIKEQLDKKGSKANLYGMERAAYYTFTEKPGEMVNAVINLVNKIPGGRFVVPFISVPTNLIRQGVRMSPFGTAQLAYRTGKRVIQGKNSGVTIDELVERTAEQLLAWGAVMALSASIDDDDPWITGSPEGEYGSGKHAFELNGRPPFSIRIGKKWYSYKYIEPLSTALALTVDGIMSFKKARDGKVLADVSKGLMRSGKKVVAEKSYLQSLGQLLNMIEDPEYKFAQQWVPNFVASWVPNLYRQTKTALDDSYTDSKDRDKAKSLMKTVWDTSVNNARLNFSPLPKVDVFGREVRKDMDVPSPFLWRLLSPMESKPADNQTNTEKLLWNYNKNNPDDEYWPSLYAPVFKLNGKSYYMDTPNYIKFTKKVGGKVLKESENLIKRGYLKVNKPTERDIKIIRDIRREAVNRGHIEAVKQGLAKEY